MHHTPHLDFLDAELVSKVAERVDPILARLLYKLWELRVLSLEELRFIVLGDDA